MVNHQSTLDILGLFEMWPFVDDARSTELGRLEAEWLARVGHAPVG